MRNFKFVEITSVAVNGNQTLSDSFTQEVIESRLRGGMTWALSLVEITAWRANRQVVVASFRRDGDLFEIKGRIVCGQ